MANGNVYRSIVERISDGTFAPGAPLREEAIAEELGTSRTPVREALRTLAAEGLVDLTRNRGATVRVWTHQHIFETYGIRAVLYSYAARLAAQNEDKSRLELLENLQDEMERLVANRKQGFLHELAELNDEFHLVIVQMTNNVLLEKLIHSLSSVAMVSRTFRWFENEDLERSMMQHRDMIRGIRTHDVEFTEAIMSSHVLAARPAALAMLHGSAGDDMPKQS